MADGSGLMHRFEKLLGELAVRAHRKPMVTWAMAAVLTAVGAFFAAKLPMIADLEKLLPKTFESVQGLEPVKEHFGGIGYLVVVGMDADVEQLQKFADEYAPRLEKELDGVRYVDHKRASGFFKDRALYYLSTADLEEVARRVKEREKYERRQANPMLVKLDEEEPPSLDMSDIEAKYGTRSDQRMSSGGDYYLDPDKKMVVLLLKPARMAADLTFSEKLVNDTEAFFAKEDLKRFGPNFKIGLTGTVKYKVDQQRQLTNDMTKATTLAFLLLIGYLVWHFRSIVSPWFVLVPVSVGLAWTYGITYFLFGSINILTGFLGAVLGGLGTEHGIHLMGRYGALRAEGKSSEEATREAFMHTGVSAVESSLVAALTFISLAYSEFRAFREFGVIAAIGMLVVIISYFMVLPSALGVCARLGWKPAAIVYGKGKLAQILPVRFKHFAIGFGIPLLALIFLMGKVRFDYDFRALEDSTMPSFELDKETNRILGYNMEPVVILTKSTESERALVPELKKREKTAAGPKSTIDFVAALSELVPQDQDKKHAILARIKTTLDKVNPETLDEPTRKKFPELMRMVSAQPFTREDIPYSARRQFEGVKKSEGGFVLIFPNIRLSDGLEVVRFANDVRGIQLPNGERFSAAGEAMVLADVLLMVQREGKPILIMAFVSVLLAMTITLGSIRVALVCMMPTVLSLLALVGLMGVLDIPFNYLNILLIPVLIGTTVDAGIHLTSRISESHGNFAPVFSETGRAIVGGLITSGVGFSAMLMADHPGLNSLGRLAVVGFSLNAAVMMLFFPAVLLWFQSKGLMRNEA